MFFFRSLQCLDCTRSFLTLLVFIENITPQHCKLNRMPKGQKFRKSLNFLQRHRSGKLQIFKGHNLNNIRCPKTEDHVIFYLNLKMKAQSGMWNKFFSRFAIHFISYFSSFFDTSKRWIHRKSNYSFTSFEMTGVGRNDSLRVSN